jgi:hypothetical protein
MAEQLEPKHRFTNLSTVHVCCVKWLSYWLVAGSKPAVGIIPLLVLNKLTNH